MANNSSTMLVLFVLCMCCCCSSSIMIPGSYYGYLKSVANCFAGDSEECKFPSFTGISSMFGFKEMIAEKCVENEDKEEWAAGEVSATMPDGTIGKFTKGAVCGELTNTEQ